MISSPCKTCPKKDLPKEDCLKDCQLLKAIQDVQMSSEGRYSSIGIDYTEDTRYTIPQSITIPYESF